MLGCCRVSGVSKGHGRALTCSSFWIKWTWRSTNSAMVAAKSHVTRTAALYAIDAERVLAGIAVEPTRRCGRRTRGRHV